MTRPTLIVAALAREVSAVVSRLESVSELSTTEKFPGRVWTACLPSTNLPVIVASMGVGKLLATLQAQRLIDRFHPGHVLCCGVCGGNPEYDQGGDVVIGTAVVQADFDLSQFGDKLGQFQGPTEDEKFWIAPLDGFGATWAANTELRDSVDLLPIEGRLPTLLSGAIASMDRIASTTDELVRLHTSLGFAGIDMESAAVGWVAHFNDIPATIVKSILDRRGIFELGFYQQHIDAMCQNAATVALQVATSFALR